MLRLGAAHPDTALNLGGAGPVPTAGTAESGCSAWRAPRNQLPKQVASLARAGLDRRQELDVSATVPVRGSVCSPRGHGRSPLVPGG